MLMHYDQAITEVFLVQGSPSAIWYALALHCNPPLRSYMVGPMNHTEHNVVIPEILGRLQLTIYVSHCFTS